MVHELRKPFFQIGFLDIFDTLFGQTLLDFRRKIVHLEFEVVVRRQFRECQAHPIFETYFLGDVHRNHAYVSQVVKTVDVVSTRQFISF